MNNILTFYCIIIISTFFLNCNKSQYSYNQNALGVEILAIPFNENGRVAFKEKTLIKAPDEISFKIIIINRFYYEQVCSQIQKLEKISLKDERIYSVWINVSIDKNLLSFTHTGFIKYNNSFYKFDSELFELIKPYLHDNIISTIPEEFPFK